MAELGKLLLILGIAMALLGAVLLGRDRRVLGGVLLPGAWRTAAAQLEQGARFSTLPRGRNAIGAAAHLRRGLQRVDRLNSRMA